MPEIAVWITAPAPTDRRVTDAMTTVGQTLGTTPTLQLDLSKYVIRVAAINAHEAVGIVVAALDDADPQWRDHLSLTEPQGFSPIRVYGITADQARVLVGNGFAHQGGTADGAGAFHDFNGPVGLSPLATQAKAKGLLELVPDARVEFLDE